MPTSAENGISRCLKRQQVEPCTAAAPSTPRRGSDRFGRRFPSQTSTRQRRRRWRCALRRLSEGKKSLRKDTQELSGARSEVLTVARCVWSSPGSPPAESRFAGCASGDRYYLRGRDARRPPLPPRRGVGGATCRPPPAPAAPRCRGPGRPQAFRGQHGGSLLRESRAPCAQPPPGTTASRGVNGHRTMPFAFTRGPAVLLHMYL